jgi:hypothetical protein
MKTDEFLALAAEEGFGERKQEALKCLVTVKQFGLSQTLTR